MIHDLKVKLQGGGRFVFSSDEVFDFSNPILIRYGHFSVRLN